MPHPNDITELTDDELNWIWCGTITELGLNPRWSKHDLITEFKRRGWETEGWKADPNRETRRLMARWYREGITKLQHHHAQARATADAPARGGGGGS